VKQSSSLFEFVSSGGTSICPLILETDKFK